MKNALCLRLCLCLLAGWRLLEEAAAFAQRESATRQSGAMHSPPPSFPSLRKTPRETLLFGGPRRTLPSSKKPRLRQTQDKAVPGGEPSAAKEGLFSFVQKNKQALPVRLLENLELFQVADEGQGGFDAASSRAVSASLKLESEAERLALPVCSPKLPAEHFRPKQSLGQSFLVEDGVSRRIVLAFCREVEASERRQGRSALEIQKPRRGAAVVEVGPGTGALTRWLFAQFPDMLAVEIDAKCVALLSQRLPGLRVLHEDVLQLDFPHLARSAGRLRLVGNLPFYLTSQLLCCMLDCRRFVDLAVLTLQKEVAERLVAQPGEEAYSRLSVIFALFAETSLLFKLPSHVFYPPPKVTAGVVSVRFSSEPDATLLDGVDPRDLKKVLFAAFGQRRKMLRQSLKSILPPGVEVPQLYAPLRPQALPPEQFVHLTAALFGRRLHSLAEEETATTRAASLLDEFREEKHQPPRVAPPVWRKAKHGLY